MSFVAEIRTTYDFVSVGSQGGCGARKDIPDVDEGEG